MCNRPKNAKLLVYILFAWILRRGKAFLSKIWFLVCSRLEKRTSTGGFEQRKQ